MPSIGQVAAGASLPTSVGLSLMKVPNPYVVAAGAALSLVGLVDKIGQGRKAANKFTQNGGPQDILNKQLAAISASGASAQEKSQATDVAWRSFLQAADQFASANPKQSKVVKQAIYETPDLTNTVQSLLGNNPLDKSYTDLAAPGMATGNTRPNPGPSVGGTLLRTAANVGLPFAMNALQGNQPISSTEWNPETGQWETIPGTSSGGGGGGGITLPGGNANAPGGGSLLQRLLPSLISGGTSILGGIFGSNAANRAAETQSDAALEAARLQTQAGQDALNFNREALAQQQQNLQPWLDSGAGALRSIEEMLANPFVMPTQEEAMQDPGIQFQMQQGQRALEAYERAHGKLLSGKAVKDINTFAQGVASQGYSNVANRKLQEREANLNPLLSMAGLGQTSMSQSNAAISNAANQNANIGLTTAGNVGNFQTQGANARASGYVGSANSMINAVQNIGNNIMQSQSIADIMRRLQPNMGFA